MPNDFEKELFKEWKNSKQLSTSIVVTLNVEGVHDWNDILSKGEECDDRIQKEVIYLGHQHRHNFEIKVTFDVTHSNRDLEFICVKHDIEDLLNIKFYNHKLKLLDFGSRSCEMICEEILELFYFNYSDDYEELVREISVSEDGEFFGILTINPK